MRYFDIDQLRTFVAATEAGSLTAAATQVSLSQSAVSEQLRKLEERAGHALLTRSRTGVTLTPAGHRLLGYARKLLALSEEAWRDLHGVALQGELRLGVTDYYRPRELATLLARLGQRHPGVRLHVSVLKSDQVEAGHARGEFDVGIVMHIAGAKRPGSGKTAGALLRRERLLWMAAPGLRHRHGEVLRLLALPDTCALHRFTTGLLTRRRVPHAVAHVASGVAGLQSAIAAGLGVACLNESALAPGVGPLAEPHRLPALPQVSFHLLPGRAGEGRFAGQAVELLAEHFD